MFKEPYFTENEVKEKKKKRERERSLNTLVKVTGAGNVVLSPVFIL